VAGNIPNPSTFWLLGLAVDQMSLDQATTLIGQRIRDHDSFVFATPNLNFLRTANADPAFQAAVLRSDLGLADGTPLLWLARLAGFRLPERVAGSDLFDQLMSEADPDLPTRIFFFGGPPGSAPAARDRVNTIPGIQGVGALTPGFGSVDDLSDDRTLDVIRTAAPNFLVVALGARKGHLWLQRNRTKLPPMVSSHLGAVVNFAAGTVKRAPRWVAQAGMEWLWRIIQEPNLFSRYRDDALFLAGLVVTRWLLAAIRPRRFAAVPPDAIMSTNCDLSEHHAGQWRARIRGPFAGATVEAFDARLRTDVPPGALLDLDLSETTRIDARGLGALYCWRFRRGWRCALGQSPLPATLLADIRFHRASALIDQALASER
jgi:N-acetylglucosaminyldiphosphoundecaprenol N-acetyl-beta-D-mannosaminyltransferase